MGAVYLGPHSVAEEVVWSVGLEQGIDVASPRAVSSMDELTAVLAQDSSWIAFMPAAYLGRERYTLSWLFRLPPAWRVVGYIPIECEVWLWKRPGVPVTPETPVVTPLEWKWATEAAMRRTRWSRFRTDVIHTAEAAEQVACSEEPLLALARWSEGQAYHLEPLSSEPIPAEEFPFGVYILATEMIAGASHSNYTLFAVREERETFETLIQQARGLQPRQLRKEFPLIDHQGQRWLVMEYLGHCSLSPLCDYLRVLTAPLTPDSWRILGAYHVYDVLIC